MSDNLLKKAEASGIFHLPPSRQSAIETAATQAHLCLLKAEIDKQSTAAEVLRHLGAELNFPIWYGANFDALYDCITDPDWQPAKGHVLLINGIARLRESDPTDFATLIEVFQAAAEARRAMQSPFWVLIDAPARGIPTLPEA
jgi:RNAse (barnase) inhibitor barstar